MYNNMNTYNALTAIGRDLDKAFVNKINIDTDKVLNVIITYTYNNGQNSLKTIGDVFSANNIHSRAFCLKALNRAPKTTAVSNAIHALNYNLSKVKFVYGDRKVLRAVTFADVGKLLHCMINAFAPTLNTQQYTASNPQNAPVQLNVFKIKKEPSDVALARESVKALDEDKANKKAVASK